MQLVGTAFDKALDFIGGAYVFKESGTEIQATKLDYRPIFLQDVVGRGDITNKSQSVFAQGSYHIPQLQGLSLTAGLRYTWDQREMKRVGINNGKCAILSADIGGVPITPCERTGEYKHGALTYTLGADWQIDSSRLLYFVTRKGYRSGGINPVSYTHLDVYKRQFIYFAKIKPPPVETLKTFSVSGITSIQTEGFLISNFTKRIFGAFLSVIA